jgi:hypothetical protein
VKLVTLRYRGAHATPLRYRGAHVATRAGISRSKKAFVGLLATTYFVAGASAAFASPAPPTNGGNGAGQSGQCTGPQDDRPASCQSQGGPGNQP